MNITQIRNVSLRIDYSGARFLIDPMHGDEGACPSLAGASS